MTHLTEGDLEDLAFGAAVLGTGGGGDPYIGRLLAQQAIADHGPVELVGLDEVGDDALVLPVAMMGAPTVMVEKIPGRDDLQTVVRMVEARLGRKATHLVPIEAGGINSLIPVAAAAQMGLPLVDADGMGRAFPELQMVMPTMGGIAATPMALADDKGNSAVLDTVDNVWTERLARTITIEMGCSSVLSNYPLEGRQARQHLVAGSLSLCRKIGAEVREARQRHHDPVDAALHVITGTRLFTGKVVDVSRRTSGGFARGSATLTGTGLDEGSTLELQFQNEHLVATVDGAVRAVVPDLICLFDAESAAPITTEGLRYGLRVVASAAPCDPRWKSPDGLALVGPPAFGLDVEHRPIASTAEVT
ncbi:DUF917 domain-containing protein [Actinobacteria bacterium YIM 96077]|uniref:DUF917 domain-containing protein n=1 Tax=Phytoactinopolyspora halophila TaxID=1981511 RepID=A0A329R0H1_9ACTN|nr:DUF917 domain-containing protein [Phytoactinopolyspora halophila]AYY11427.1 DUF917 domain-containing protein [Actinobacteria bacterium YIM 96077]RAW18091.1 DUF917 domain-containing protein [Phytoactinopolyspora halophila]